MSERVAIGRSPRQIWALPGSRHDLIVKIARVGFPGAIGVLAVALIAAPLASRREVSFVLDKNKVALARERLRVTEALYRGEDSKGQPFSLHAGSAVQTNSKDPVVRMQGLRAEIRLAEGPASISAGAGRYNMEREIVSIDGPVKFQTSDGYQLQTRDIAIGLNTRRIASGGAVTGRMPLGTFSAGRISANLQDRSVVLDGRASLHIRQGAIR